ncbi:hypothetical protein VUR80DRAFT_592 [Thermomyces stellatus]
MECYDEAPCRNVHEPSSGGERTETARIALRFSSLPYGPGSATSGLVLYKSPPGTCCLYILVSRPVTDEANRHPSRDIGIYTSWSICVSSLKLMSYTRSPRSSCIKAAGLLHPLDLTSTPHSTTLYPTFPSHLDCLASPLYPSTRLGSFWDSPAWRGSHDGL